MHTKESLRSCDCTHTYLLEAFIEYRLTLIVLLAIPMLNLIKKGLLTALVIVLMQPAWATNRVGEITLVIGQSEIERAANPNNAPAKGDLIQQGDIVKTSANGHVHIRFVDGALVSVRPNSVLSIQEFRYNPADPAVSVVRMNLDRGEVRSISGAAAQAAKDRFRLNTPLVAIGVKGTDFVTQTSQEGTRVMVNQGAIVMAPFDQNCKAQALGVCSGSRARELTADMVGMALIYKSGFADPSLQILPGVKDPAKPISPDRKGIDDPKVNSVDDKLLEGLFPVARLAWGRWSRTPAPGDSLTLSFRDAMQGREVTVGDGYYFLFREPSAVNLLPSLTSQAEFKLTGSAAQYRSPSNDISAAKVDAASLSIDFGARTYATQLQVSAPGISPQAFSYSGKVDPASGIFLSEGGNGKPSLAGSLTLTGRQAGYLFSQPVGNGSLSGATLWGR
ncbi:MAG: hypothetical protein CFE38_13365 [Comamonadaceae bacterium PBBC1]|nr:MAG: hypothetical protein CFE38_13365 [Comamonadaceae bacterium PBBC1]